MSCRVLISMREMRMHAQQRARYAPRHASLSLLILKISIQDDVVRAHARNTRIVQCLAILLPPSSCYMCAHICA